MEGIKSTAKTTKKIPAIRYIAILYSEVYILFCTVATV